jgi:hypothetical protein
MEMTPVESSNVESVGYDADSEELHVQFKGGGLYRYEGVPQETHTDMMGSDSIGKFIDQSVKGQFPFTKLE